MAFSFFETVSGVRRTTGFTPARRSSVGKVGGLSAGIHATVETQDIIMQSHKQKRIADGDR